MSADNISVIKVRDLLMVTMPADPDDLVNHKATLEAMLDGSHWTARP